METSGSLEKGAGGDLTYPIDRKAEDLVFEEAEKWNEPLTIISEEYGCKEILGGGPRLLIDPVDGSRNAISGLPVFSTSIAVLDGDSLKHAQTAYIINLVNGDEFWSVKGGGAFYNGKTVRTQQDSKLRIVLFEARSPGPDIQKITPVLSLFGRCRCLGSIAVDMALLAQGAVSLFLNPAPSRSFDFAAGYLLVREAGGIVTDLTGEDIGDVKAGVEKSVTLLASCNEGIHSKALKSLDSR